MDILTAFMVIFGSIAAIGVVITIVVLINKRQKSIKEDHANDEDKRLDTAEQYRRMYGDRYKSNSK